MRAAALLCTLIAAAASCARPMAPPGGERDTVAPRLLSSTPEPLAVIAAGGTPVIFRFDERISERGFSEALFTVSPLDSALRVDRSGSEVRVRIDGGWRANRVYRVVLLPGLTDLFGNVRSEAVELVFSTGTAIDSTALAGMVLDRLTGMPARRGVVDAVHLGENARYTAIADSSGFYSLRYLPLGEYDVHAYDDQNTNRRRDFLEPLDSGYTAVLAQAADTAALIFHVLSPDTSAPRVVRAQAVDSLHVYVELDDYVDQGEPLEAVRAEVRVLPDSVSYALASRVLTEREFSAEQRAADLAAAADTAGVPLDTTRAAADTAVIAPVGPPAPQALLPVRELIVALDRPLRPGSYMITLAGIVNLHGFQGGGTAEFDVSAQPPPAALPPDTSSSR